MSWRDENGNLCFGIKPEIIETEMPKEGGETENELQKTAKGNRRSRLGIKPNKDSGVDE